MNDKLRQELEKLALRCWKVEAARFEASRRMVRCKNASTLCLAMLSLEIIVINLLVFIPSLQLNNPATTVVTVCLSAFVLVLSLLVSQLQYAERANTYNESGLALSSLEKRIYLTLSKGITITDDIVANYLKEFEDIINKWNLNHSPMDYDWAFQRQIKREKSYTEFLDECKCEDQEKTECNKPFRKRTFQKYNQCKYNRAWIKWHFLRSDMIYYILAALGVLAILAVIFFGKTANVFTPEMMNYFGFSAKTLL